MAQANLRQGRRKTPNRLVNMDEYTRSIKQTVEALQQGKVIAYPTEAVYGLGCDPFNPHAVIQILTLKNRSIKKGFILIASEWKQVEALTQPLDPKTLAHVFSTWPGPVTWLFPATTEVPYWVKGDHNTVAIRVTAHPLARLLCRHFGGAIISTSANLEGQPPTQDLKMLRIIFGNKIDGILEGALGTSKRPSEIRDAISGEILRVG